MLFVVFQLGRDRYALDASCVAEVLPLVQIKPIPRAAPGIAGVFSYRGLPVPVVDLSLLALGRPASARLSTRLLLVQVPDAHGRERLLGLIAERATETLRREAADFVAPGVRADGAPYLGPVVNDPRGIIQWIEVGKLLPAAVRDALFAQAAEVGA